jgi:hypothetical protein
MNPRVSVQIAGVKKPVCWFKPSEHKAPPNQWVACWYDDGWQPPMWADGNKRLTRFGEFVLAQL